MKFSPFSYALLPVLLFACGPVATAENNEKSTEEPKLIVVNEEPTRENRFQLRKFADASAALRHVLEKTKPKVLGLGEYHQLEKTVSIRSAISRFTEELLPVLAPASRDLVVETWIPRGCGETEKKVIQEVDEVSQRPAETENETIRLLREAKSRGVAPHILDVSCEEYEKVFLGKEGVDFYLMLEMVGRLLKEQGEKALAAGAGDKVDLKNKDGKMLVLFGGAIHNDIHPSEDWQGVTFGPALAKRVQGRYVEIDLCVPEYIEKSDIVAKEPWFSAFTANASTSEVLLIETAPDAFVIVFKKTEQAGQ